MTYEPCAVYNREIAWPTTHVIFKQRACATYDSSDFSRDFQTEGSCDLRLSRFPDREIAWAATHANTRELAWPPTRAIFRQRAGMICGLRDLQTKSSPDLQLRKWDCVTYDSPLETERERESVNWCKHSQLTVFTFHLININAFFLFLLVFATNNLQATYRNVNKTKWETYTYICWTLGLLINDCAWKKQKNKKKNRNNIINNWFSLQNPRISTKNQKKLWHNENSTIHITGVWYELVSVP